jgi:hypothetical protein
MLTALEQGVKGNKWFSLMDKVYALRHRLESRMRETRLSGSEGGGVFPRTPYPYRVGFDRPCHSIL